MRAVDRRERINRISDWTCAGRRRMPRSEAMTQFDKMLSRKEGGAGYLIFNNPARHNAVSLEMWDATRRILDDFESDEAVRVMVVTGAGGKAFVSGADISEFEQQRASQEQVERYSAVSDKAFTGLYESPKPTIAMIRGDWI